MVKKAQREKRKNKIPKHVKKGEEKTAKAEKGRQNAEPCRGHSSATF